MKYLYISAILMLSYCCKHQSDLQMADSPFEDQVSIGAIRSRIDSINLLPRQTTMIWLDRSSSYGLLPEVERDHFLSFVGSRFDSPGDMIITGYVYANTQSKANRFEFAIDLRAPNVGEEKSLSENEEALSEYITQIQISRRSQIKKCLDNVFAAVPSSPGTHILETLPLIVSELKNGTQKLAVVYYSDMVQESPFSSPKINTRAEAKAAGHKDLKRLMNDFELDATSLSGLEGIQIRLPVTGMDNYITNAVWPIYWEIIFTGLGGPTPHYASQQL